jgi:hypothetical protein
MNDNAAHALNLLSRRGPTTPAVQLDDQLSAMLAHGLIRNDDALVLAADHRGQLRKATSARETMDRMGWDVTAYECQATSFHLEDHAPVTVEILDDGEPRISEDDQVTLLNLGLQVADTVAHLVRQLPEPVPVRCTISAGSTNGTFRLHQLRPDQSWTADDLDRYREEKLITVDITPMPED